MLGSTIADTGPCAETSSATAPRCGVGETTISDPSPSRNTPVLTGNRIPGSRRISAAVHTPGARLTRVMPIQ